MQVREAVSMARRKVSIILLGDSVEGCIAFSSLIANDGKDLPKVTIKPTDTIVCTH